MLIPAPFVTYLAKELTKRLVSRSGCAFRQPDRVAEAFETIVYDDLSLEDEINAEARALLAQYNDYIRLQSISYHEMFSRVKRKILAERKVTPAAHSGRGPRTMKLNREKVLEISHKLASALPRIPGTLMGKGWNQTRIEIQKHLTDILMLEERCDQHARRMITSQEREIQQGSEEWQVMHRNYYEEELKKYGVHLRWETPEVPA